MIVNVCPIYMSTDNIGVLAFGKSRGELTANLICFIRRDLSRLERLPHLIGNHVVFVGSSGEYFILTLGEKKLGVGGFSVTLIR